MDLHLQFGFGMMSHTRELFALWKGGTAILSPRDLTKEQMTTLAKDLRTRGGKVLLDPQCFVRESDHERLVSHEYFTAFRSHSESGYRDGPGIPDVLQRLSALGKELQVAEHILPSYLLVGSTGPWYAVQDTVIEAAPSCYGSDPVIATLPLGVSAMMDEGVIEELVEHVRAWPVSGFYVIAENPTGYLVENPVWLANLLVLVSGLKLQGKKVIVGYCSHQMLSLAAAGADAIAAGTWLNVRAFSPERFSAPEEGTISRRSVWYYCPQALSEFKIPFLDIAKRVGVLDVLRPPASLANTYAAPLFSGPSPTTIEWGEQSAFRHYLCTVREQARSATLTSYDDTLAWQRKNLEDADTVLKTLHSKGISGQDRDFGPLISVNQAALAALDSARGSVLRRKWASLI